MESFMKINLFPHLSIILISYRLAYANMIQNMSSWTSVGGIMWVATAFQAAQLRTWMKWQWHELLKKLRLLLIFMFGLLMAGNFFKKTSKFSRSFYAYEDGVYQDEECCSNKSSYDTNHGFVIKIFNSGPSPKFLIPAHQFFVEIYLRRIY